MFNFIRVSFPETDFGPTAVYSAEIIQEKYKHDIIKMKFRDWDVSYDILNPGSPVQVRIAGVTENKDIYGYIHHIKPDRTPGKNFTEMVVIGASYPFRQPSQTIYKDITADQVAVQIAEKYNFACYAVPHPRVYPQIAQAGHTDWELLVRLAKQSGYTLRATNTELYFQPMHEDFHRYKEEAKTFTMRQANDSAGSTMYSFRPIIGEDIDYDGNIKSAPAAVGVDTFTNTPMSFTQQKRETSTRAKEQSEFFDSFLTDTVANTPEIAKYESEASDLRGSFPYRAVAEVLGSASLQPDMPVYLNGIGSNYSGFWTILKVEHKIIEEELNRHRYTTILHVGTDSLGETLIGPDSREITQPPARPIRKLLYGVRQTKVRPVTYLNRITVPVNATERGSFGSIENRAKLNINNRDTSPARWVTGIRSLDPIVNEPITEQFVVERLERMRAR
jgi:hypothetical protein